MKNTVNKQKYFMQPEFVKVSISVVEYIKFIACRRCSVSIQINISIISVCQLLSMLNISDLLLYRKVGYISLASKLAQQ